jgi:hypothetical protein
MAGASLYSILLPFNEIPTESMDNSVENADNQEL